MSDIETQVLNFIREERPDLEIGPDTELMEAGVLDSIALIKSIQFAESTFGITIPDSDIDPSIFATITSWFFAISPENIRPIASRPTNGL